MWSARRVLHSTRSIGCGRGLERPGFDHYLDLILAGHEFSFARRSHGFWDRLADLTEVVPTARRAVRATRTTSVGVDESLVMHLTPEERRELETRNYIKGFWEEEYVSDLIRDLQHPHPEPAYLEAAQFCPGVNPTPLLREVYTAFHTSGRSFHDALVWRRSVVAGRFGELIDALRRYRVIVVGPPHTSSYGALVGLEHFEHVRIHPSEAFAARMRILAELEQRIHSDPGGTAVLFEAASLAPWLIHRLWDSERPRFLLDVGRALDVWYPDVIRSQRWFQGAGPRMVRNMRLEHLYRR